MLNLAVHIVTTAIQSVEIYRICICYFFTKYNNNIADCTVSSALHRFGTQLFVYAILSTVLTGTGEDTSSRLRALRHYTAEICIAVPLDATVDAPLINQTTGNPLGR